MKNLNEDINRLRQIMSYNRSKGLLVNESQYDITEQKVDYDRNMNNFIKHEQGLNKGKENNSTIWDSYELAKSIAKQIFTASKGMGTDESRFLDAVKDINSIVTLKFVDDILKTLDYGDNTEGFEYFVNGEFGYEDADVVESIVRHLKSIGVNATYKTNGRSMVSGSFVLRTSLEDVKTELPTTKTPLPQGPENPKQGDESPIPGKEDNEGCPTEEDVLTGKFAISKNSMGDKQCNVVHTIQKALLKKLGKQDGGLSLGANDFGYYGPKTVALVFAFQSLKGLKEDGIVGKNTMKSLLS